MLIERNNDSNVMDIERNNIVLVEIHVDITNPFDFGAISKFKRKMWEDWILKHFVDEKFS